MKSKQLTQGALIAALYVTLTAVSAMFGLAGGSIQVRLSEALTILPAFTSAAVPGLFIGCILANLLTGAAVWDIVFGSLATLLGALGTKALAKKRMWLAPIPPIFWNTLIVPFILQWVYGVPDALGYLFFTLFVGELISCGALGLPLGLFLKKLNKLQ